MAAFFEPGTPESTNLDDTSKFWSTEMKELFANTVVATLRYVAQQKVVLERGRSNPPSMSGLQAALVSTPGLFIDMAHVNLGVDIPIGPPPALAKQQPALTQADWDSWEKLKVHLNTQYTRELGVPVGREPAHSQQPRPALEWACVLPLLEHMFWTKLRDDPNQRMRRLRTGGRFFGSGATVFVVDDSSFHDRFALCGLPAGYWLMESYTHVPVIGPAAPPLQEDEVIKRMLAIEERFAELPVWDEGKHEFERGDPDQNLTAQHYDDCVSPAMLRELAAMAADRHLGA